MAANLSNKVGPPLQIHVESDITNIMFYMYVEAWLRSWTDKAAM